MGDLIMEEEDGFFPFFPFFLFLGIYIHEFMICKKKTRAPVRSTSV